MRPGKLTESWKFARFCQWECRSRRPLPGLIAGAGIEPFLAPVAAFGRFRALPPAPSPFLAGESLAYSYLRSMKKTRLSVLSLLTLLVLGLWFIEKNDEPANPPAVASTITNPASPSATVATSGEPSAATAAAQIPKIVPRAAGAVVARRPGWQRVPTASDAVAKNGRPPAAMPLPADFLDRVVDASGKRAVFTLPDGRAAAGTVELVRSDADGTLLVQGRLTLPEPGFYFFQR